MQFSTLRVGSTFLIYNIYHNFDIICLVISRILWDDYVRLKYFCD